MSSTYTDALRGAYPRDHWRLQPSRVEVWSEKGTVRGTLAPILDTSGVTFRVMHGYASAIAVHQVVEDQAADLRPLRAPYVGHWDPSGSTCPRWTFPGGWPVSGPRRRRGGAGRIARRIALTMPDVEDSALASFPTDSKQADPRWRWYRQRYGPRCWELDALDPRVLRDRVAVAIGPKSSRPLGRAVLGRKRSSASRSTACSPSGPAYFRAGTGDRRQ